MSHLSKLSFLALAGAGALLASSPATALTQDEISLYTGADRQQVLEEGSKKENALVWYCTMRVDEGCRPITAAFIKKYPHVKADYISAESEEILQRTMAERRANSVRADVALASIADGFKAPGLAQAFKSPQMAGFDPQMMDPDGYWISTRTTWMGFAWNTQKISSADAPHKWDDLINPKYKSKMFWASSAGQGAPRVITQIRVMYGEDKAMDYLKKLQANDIRTAPGAVGAQIAGITTGEYPIIIGMGPHQVSPLKANGQPLDADNPDPAIAKSSAMAVIKGAPHPYTAILFADFILSQQGQQAISDAGYNPTRLDVKPNPDNAWFQPNLNGKKEILLPGDKENAYNEKSSEIYRDMFR